MDEKYYQSDKLADRIDWESILPMERYAGGHDDQMKGLLKDATIIAHWNEGSWQGYAATGARLNDTGEIVIYNDSYGSCPGCDVWDGATDDDVRQMCRQLACGAYIFKNLEDCKEFLAGPIDKTKSIDWTWSNTAGNLLNNINSGTID
jgi:hypothetical protein